MASRFIFPSASNGFVAEPTGQVIQYILREDEFPLNRYVRYIQSPRTVGIYAVVSRDEFVRVVSDNAYAWYDGDERPRGDSNKVLFETVEFATFRRDYPWTLGYMTIEQATVWKPKLSHMGAAISKAMVNRTNRVVSLAQTSANWPTSQVATANTLNGGAGGWATGSDDPSSPNYLAIYKSLLEAARRINLATNAKVKPKDLKLVVSPGVAIKMGESSEMTNYVRESPVAMQVLKEGLDPDLNKLWSLPSQYKGFEICVEDTPIVTEFNTFTGATISSAGSLVEATTNRTYVMSDSSAFLVARPGSIDGEYGAPSFEALQLYHYGGLLEVFMFDDARNKRVDGHVEENIKEVIAAQYAGFLITGI
jgi:hypothetical protein